METPHKTIRIPAPEKGIDVDVSDYLGIINTEEFQRLSRINQMSCADFVFPGASHKRKEHSIGTFYHGRRIGRSVGLDEYNQRLLEVCCLLHDIGHGAYSHLSEVIMKDMFNISHDDKILDKLDRIEKEIRSVGVNPDDVRSVFGKENNLYKLILTILGADKLDYITRDRLHCGLPTVDVEKITEYARFDGKNYYVEEKAENFITDFIKNWWGAHKEMYLRKSVELANSVKMKMILYAIENEELDPDKLFDMDDGELDFLLFESGDGDIQEMNNRFRRRYLPKAVGVLKIGGYESRENLRGKPIHVEGLNEDEYKEFSNKFDSLGEILELEKRFQKEFNLMPYETIITTSPHIGRLIPKEVTIIRKGTYDDGKETLMSIYDFSKNKFREYLEEEMKGHYAVRFAVSEEKRKEVYDNIKKAGLKNFVFEK